MKLKMKMMIVYLVQRGKKMKKDLMLAQDKMKQKYNNMNKS